MKAKTRVVTAAKELYETYANYSRRVLNIPVVPAYPSVTWKAGNTKEGARGTWIIDGREYPGTVDQVVAHFQERTVYWEDKLRRKSEPVIKAGA